MLRGGPGEGTRIRTVEELRTTTGESLPAGTPGTLQVAVTAAGEEPARDIFVALPGERGAVQVLREDVEELTSSGSR